MASPTAAGLRRALDQQALALAYQPIVDLRAGTLAGFEALLRWTDPDAGEVPAPVAVDLAQRAGLVEDLGDWVLEQAVEDLCRLRRDRDDLRVNVNLCASQFERAALVRTVNRLLAERDLPADALVLEITESNRLPPGGGRTVRRLVDLGVQLSADDVGTGHASAMRVLGLPLQEMKIEVELLTQESDAGGSFADLVAQASGSGLRAVVERIETEADLRDARAAGATHAQGFLLGRPAPLAAALAGAG